MRLASDNHYTLRYKKPESGGCTAAGLLLPAVSSLPEENT